MTDARQPRPTSGATRSSSIMALALCAMALGPLIVTASENQPGGKPGTVVLFDGKTLEGWKKVDFLGTGGVKVEDGTIVMEAGRSMTGITSTRKDLPTTNYELSYEAMRRSG